MTKYIVFIVFVIAAFIYGWFTVNQQQSLTLIIDNQSAQKFIVDVVGDGCKTPCLQIDNGSQEIASQADFSSLIHLNKQGELRFMVRSSKMSNNYLLVNDVALMKAKKLAITLFDDNKIDIRLD